jgi:hypothetical protein
VAEEAGARADVKRLRLRELHGLERIQSAHRVAEWGFPRPVACEELVVGHWFEWGPEGIFWLVPDGQNLEVHIAIAKGAWLTRHARDWEAILGVLGDILGAKRIYGWPIAGTPSGRAVTRLLRSLGWTPDGPRWYLSLDGEEEGAGQG